MPHSVSTIDRLRIERVVWQLDQRLYDLPRATRIADRREVRENLLTAAGDVGTTAALQRLGDRRQLAAGYLEGEFGSGPRPSWTAAAVFLLTTQLLFTALLNEAAQAFTKGIMAADAHATGTFTWRGIAYLQDTVTVTMRDGVGDHLGGAWTPLAYVLWIAGTICVGRLWRIIPVWRTRRAHRAATSTA